MSKWPWPERLKRIVRSTPSASALPRLLDRAVDGVGGSGAGMMPSLRANCTAAAKTSFCMYASARIRPSRTSCEISGATPW